MPDAYDRITLLCCLKAAQTRNKELESEERYVWLKELHQKECREYGSRILELQKEAADAHRETIRVRNYWFQVLEDMLLEFEKMQKKTKQELQEMEKRTLKAEKQRDDALDKVKELQHQFYETAVRLEEEQGKNLKLRAQINRDYENSSIPSSQSRNRRKISNNRERTGRKPGAQPGHAHHGRKKQEATQTVHLPAPKIVAEDPDFKKTKKIITKQLVSIEMILHVTEYQADVYRNSKTGEKVHAAFPAGVVDDVNYDGSIQSLLFLLNTDCAVSIDKSQRFLSDLTGGKLKISRGMINKLCREFSSKTETERKKIFADLLSCPVLHTDCTNARVNGESAYVFVCASSDEEKVLYFARKKKGHEGVKGTVTEDFRGILVHDHEITFYRYGSAHQECLAHVERYLKDSMENESSLTWNRRMRELLQRMIHYRKEHTGEASLDAQTVAGFETEYQEILDKAKEEYKRNEPSPYYREGYNLYRRMQEYKTEHLLFLHDMRVPTTNNTAERCLRDYKRKQTFAMTFRSLESIEELCHSKGVLLEVRKNNPNIYTAVMEIFNRRYGA